jgi:WD40-like Beta Propeller Repeat.
MNQGGALADGDSWGPRITRDGRYVVFTSQANNLAPGSGVAGGHARVYLRDTCRAIDSGCVPATRTVSAGKANAEADGDSLSASISGDGRFVVFASNGSNLVAGDSNGQSDVFLADLCHGAEQCVPAMTRISGAAALEADGQSFSPVVSGDGQVVAFVSGATNLVGNDSNFVADVFVTRRTKPVP